MQYLCIVYAGSGGDTLTQAQHTAISDACIDDDHALFRAGKLIAASPLQGPDTAVVIRPSGRTDGPYAETKEFVAGFMLIEAADMEEAVKIAAPGPLEGLVSLEIRPLANPRHSKTGLDRAAFFERKR